MKGEVLYEHYGTPAYVAPEILKEHGYEGPPVDVWSAGVVLYALLYGNFPFSGNTVEDLEESIQKGEYILPTDISPEVRDLLSHMLDSNPSTRITIPQIYKHPWMQCIDESCTAHNNSSMLI
jgi:serine/threonine protein kinase